MSETVTVLNLEKGGKADLTKGNAGLKKLNIGLGWDENAGTSGSFDADATCFVLKGGKLSDNSHIIYFGNLKNAACPGIEHGGDNLTGAGAGDDETIKLTLDSISPDVDAIMFVVNIYQAKSRKQNFGMIRNAFVRAYDADSKQELVRFDLSEDYSSNTGVIVAKVYRHNGEWKFEAVGTGANGDINEIAQPFR